MKNILQTRGTDMISFLVALLVLLIGFFTYGKVVEKIFGPDDRKTPALTKIDGVDYIPLPTWKIFMIQFLNIAGLGPIFGAIMGAQFGTASYLWIVFGTIFAGAVHDFFSGALSIRNGGESLPEIVGRYLGSTTKKVMCVFTLVLMVLVGAVFVSGPAELLAGMTPDWMDSLFWITVIFIYYILATILPVDKIIGKIYPLFAAALLFMALGILVMLYVKSPALPEIWDGFGTKYEKNPIFPMMFISIACGAISGFHATQSPLMARCLKNEKYARPVFYGAMIAEGIVAMIWATAAMAYFGGPEGLNNAMTEGIMVDGVLTKITPAIAVDMICKSWLGKVGAVIAVIGVVVCPITSGDTAFRSLRLTIADFLKTDQKPILKRFLICIPIFALAFFCCKMDFSTVWKYVGIFNQVLATLVLWTSAAYLADRKKPHWMCSVPAAFLTFVCVSYFVMAPHSTGGLHLAPAVGYIAGIAAAIVLLILFVVKARRR